MVSSGNWREIARTHYAKKTNFLYLYVMYLFYKNIYIGWGKEGFFCECNLLSTQTLRPIQFPQKSYIGILLYIQRLTGPRGVTLRYITLHYTSYHQTPLLDITRYMSDNMSCRSGRRILCYTELPTQPAIQEVIGAYNFHINKTGDSNVRCSKDIIPSPTRVS